MVGPWTIEYRLTTKNKIISVSLLALTMIDRATNWAEFAIILDTCTKYNAILNDKECLCRYPRLLQLIIDNVGEFSGR